ncbi:MAG: tetratricopeptide repeat protein, partial [Proteobacteria bacterium]|nr:tetratricopeptide repeat protein [Pseudomonadota bacterium]
LHLLGKGKEADNWFRQADELQIMIEGIRLYGLRGVKYVDFLFLMKRTDEAFELAKQNLEICQRYNAVNDSSRSYRCLGVNDSSRGYRCLSAIERIRGNHKDAEIHLQNALEIARKVGRPDLEIEVLLESGRLQLDIERHEDAVRDAKEVLKICDRTGFKLFEPEAEIVLGTAYLALNDIEQAKTVAHSAYEKAVGMNYRWQEGDAAHLLGEICLAAGDKVYAREWLEKAVACRKEILNPEVKESEKILKSL